MQKSNQQTGINYRTQRLASCQELLNSNEGLVMATWLQFFHCRHYHKYSHCRNSSAVRGEVLQGLGNILVQHSGTTVIKKPKLDSKSYHMKLMQECIMQINHSFSASLGGYKRKTESDKRVQSPSRRK